MPSSPGSVELARAHPLSKTQAMTWSSYGLPYPLGRCSCVVVISLSIPIINRTFAILFTLPPTRNLDRWSHSRLPPPSPLRFMPCKFITRRLQPFLAWSTCFAPAHHGRSQQFYPFMCWKINPESHHGGFRTPAPTLLAPFGGTRYEISDLRDIYSPGTRNSACSSGGCSSGGGRLSAPFWGRVRRALASRRFTGNSRRSLFGG